MLTFTVLGKHARTVQLVQRLSTGMHSEKTGMSAHTQRVHQSAQYHAAGSTHWPPDFDEHRGRLMFPLYMIRALTLLRCSVLGGCQHVRTVRLVRNALPRRQHLAPIPTSSSIIVSSTLISTGKTHAHYDVPSSHCAQYGFYRPNGEYIPQLFTRPRFAQRFFRTGHRYSICAPTPYRSTAQTE